MADPKPSPIDFLLKEIIAAHKVGLLYASICLALTIPDVCSNAETEDDELTFKIQKRYVAWCDKWVTCFTELTSEDLWALRGGVIHSGQTFGHPKNRYERVLFIVPTKDDNQFQGIVQFGKDTLPAATINTNVFCDGLIGSALSWRDAMEKNATVQRKLEGLLRYRPEGYGRHMDGIAVIA